WKELTQPATIVVQWEGAAPGRTPTGIALRVTPNTERDLPFHPLHDYRLIWRVIDAKGSTLGAGEQRFANLADPVDVTGALQPGTLPPDAGHALRLSVELQNPTGLAVVDEVLERPPE